VAAEAEGRWGSKTEKTNKETMKKTNIRLAPLSLRSQAIANPCFLNSTTSAQAPFRITCHRCPISLIFNPLILSSLSNDPKISATSMQIMCEFVPTWCFVFFLRVERGDRSIPKE
jgi:hypothetical protein